jgi:chemotaxis protein CheY-P-specific phosphatase CheC
MSTQNVREQETVYGTEEILISLCDSVSKVLAMATQSQIRYSGMVQRIHKTCLKPDIGCFVLFDGGFSGLVVINFSAPAAMELYEHYMIGMGMAKSGLANHHTSDEVSNVMGELMNQIVGDFTSKVAHDFQTHITQNQPKMLVLNKQVILSVDTNLDQPEARRVTFFTGQGNIFYLELAIDRTEFIRLRNAAPPEETASPDDVFEQAELASAQADLAPGAAPGSAGGDNEQEDLLKSLGM